jgi:uncharacterized protein (TIGR02266 family)
MQQQSSATTTIDPAGDPRSTAVRRATPRSTLRVRCGCATEQEFVQRYATDISARGMFLRTGRQLPLGARVRFELVLQSGRCALGGVGRVAWLRAAEPALGRAAGAGVAFERLRRGDRAVIERMDLARGSAPSRFDQPDEPALGASRSEPPRGALLAKLLFADLGSRGESEPGASAFLSADLSTELGDGGWRYGGRSGSADVVADLAEQLEPGAEPREPAADPAAELAVEFSPAPQTDASSPQHSTVRPAPMPIAAVAIRTAAAAPETRGARPTPAPALRARIQALRAAELAAAASAAASAAPAPAAPDELASSAKGGAPALLTATAAPPAAAAETQPDANIVVPSTPTDGDVSAAPLEDAAVSVALARAAVERAAAPSASTPVPNAKLTNAVPPVRRTAAAVPAPTAPLAPVVQAATLRQRPRSTWPLAIALSAIIVAASGVTYLALTDQLALLGL